MHGSHAPPGWFAAATAALGCHALAVWGAVGPTPPPVRGQEAAVHGDAAAERRVEDGVGEALERAEELFGIAREAVKNGERPALREAIQKACRILAETEGAGESEDVARFLDRLGLLAAEAREFSCARLAWEPAANYYGRTREETDDRLLSAQDRLAGLGYFGGDLTTSRALMEQVLSIQLRTKASDDPRLLRTRHNLAIVRNVLGDIPGSQAMFEDVLEIRERDLEPGDPELLRTRHALSIVLRQAGEYDRALEQLEEIRSLRQTAVDAGTAPANDRILMSARIGEAHVRSLTGDNERALAIAESVRESLSGLPRAHVDVLQIDAILSHVRRATGDLAGSRRLDEERLAIYEEILPADHPDRLRTRQGLAGTLAALREWEPLLDQLEALAEELDLRVKGCVILSPREARERATRIGERISPLISLSGLAVREGPAELSERARRVERATYELVETLRSVAAGGVSLAAAGEIDPALDGLREEAEELRRKVSALVDDRASRAEISRAVEQRDGIERRLRERLHAAGLVAPEVRLGALAAALPPRSAAVGYRRYARLSRDESTGESHERGWLLANVVRPDGALVRVELGPIAEIEVLVRRWRTTVGKSLQRGVALTPDAAAIEREAGVRLRRAVLDPVFAAAGEAETLHVCLDDALHVVPLSALPLEAAYVGDRWKMLYETSFARLLSAGASRDRGDDGGPWKLVAMGGISFNAEIQDVAPVIVEGAQAPPVELAVVSPEEDGEAARASQVSGGTRGGNRAGMWAPLPQTKHEVESIVALFEELFEDRRSIVPVLLTRKAATKRALLEHAPGARFLHLATHGYFANESVPASTRDPGEEEVWGERLGRSDRGLAPMTLCGLALAGANRGRNAAGQVPGIITAEELAGLDLSDCELAVLSACETNVGIRRAGLGIQSLQAALHAAGAHTAITSLWKVDDDAARELMTTFYTLYWSERGLSKAEALWEAQKALRTDFPLRDWSAWVLTGDPR